MAARVHAAKLKEINHDNHHSIHTDDGCRRPLFPGADCRADRYHRQGVHFAKKILNALLVHIPAASDLTAGAATVLAVALIALVCFLAGLLARSVTAKRVVDVLESSVLSMIPGYDYLKQESASALGLTEIGELPVVFVPMKGGGSLVFRPTR
jgi:hypothetical protein